MNRRAVLAAVALVAALAPVAPAGAAPCVTTKGAFRLTAYPAFPGEETPAHGGFAVTPADGRRVYVASQQQVLQSVDAGCTWKSVFAIPASPTAAQPYKYSQMTVRGVRTATAAGAPQRVHVFLQELAGYLRPYVYTSPNGSTDWVSATGLPPVGRIVDLATAPSDANVVYATILTGLTYLPTTYASSDGGKSFTRMTPPEVAAQSKAWFLAVDPADAKKVWATGSNTLSVTTDGGKTWAAVPAVTNVAQVVAARGPKTTLVAIAPTDAKVWRSEDGGATWTALLAPAGVQSAEFGATPRDMLVLSYANQRSDVWRYDTKLKRFVRAVATPPVQSFFAFERESGRRPAFWSYSPGKSLLRWAP